MCTVTIIPKRNHDFILTSNRDEAPNRTSLSPEIYTINNSKMLFPKDELSDGTWVGVSDKNRMLCLLNGGFAIHERSSEYRLSRGIVVKELLASEDIVKAINDFDFHDIEPFTLVIVEWNNELKFIEFVWDGNNAHFMNLPIKPRIWSSSTLYSNTMNNERKVWFKDYIKENTLDSETLFHFHKTAGIGNLDYGVIMDRLFVKTTSITQVEKSGNLVKMRYIDLKSNRLFNKQLRTPQEVNE